MLTQPKNHRKGGSISDADFSGAEAENQALSGFLPSLRVGENGNSSERNLSSSTGVSGEIGDWEIERLEDVGEQAYTSPAGVMCSYKAEKPDFFGRFPANADGEVDVWVVILQALDATLSRSTVATLLEPCRFESLADGVLTLAANSSFSRSIISKRYRGDIEAVAEELLGEPTSLRLVINEDMESPARHGVATPTPEASQPSEPAAPTINPNYPLAQSQNPTNNPKVATLLEKYGDIRGVMKNHPFFKRIQRPMDDGGWGTDLGGLIYLCKRYTLERVLWAAKQANEYQGVHTSRGSVFTYAVKNGLEKGE